MDFEILRKKLDGYKTPGGHYKNIKGELLVELLRIWESHVGPSTEIAKQLGMKRQQLARLIKEARRVAATTDAVDPAFEALQIQQATEGAVASIGIEVNWGPDKIIRFPTVDTLMDFLRKAS